MTAQQFVVDIRRFREATTKQIETLVKATALELFGKIIVRNPVDTGYSRASWFASLNEEKPQQWGHGSMAQIALVVSQYRVGDTIFFYNGAKYILKLEYGHSKQAPEGMVRLTLQEGNTVVSQIAQKMGLRS